MTLTSVYRSYQDHVNHCFIFDVEYRKPLEIEAWFQRTTNRKWHYELSNGHVTDDVT